MAKIIQQIHSLWQKATSIQKITLLGVLLLIGGLLSFFLLAREPKFAYLTEQKEGLEQILKERGISSTTREGALFVEERELKNAREALQALPQKKEGFELFDKGTWIKGEKELQILEVRALIGRLESDLKSFENVSQARVVLDIAVPRPLMKEPNKTKASVILTLKDNALLKRSELAAMSYHLASAVRGLEIGNIAISDTKGRLYQGFNSDLSAKNIADILLEERIYTESLAFLQKVATDPSLTVRVNENKATIVATLDETRMGDQALLLKQLKAIAPNSEITLTFLPFISKKNISFEIEEKKQTTKWLYALLLLPLCALIFFKKRKPEMKKPEEIANFLAKLDLAQAEKVIDELPEEIQRAVFAELEKGDARK